MPDKPRTTGMSEAKVREIATRFRGESHNSNRYAWSRRDVESAVEAGWDAALEAAAAIVTSEIASVIGPKKAKCEGCKSWEKEIAGLLGKIRKLERENERLKEYKFMYESVSK